MMQPKTHGHAEIARALTRQAAQWLVIIRFQVRPGAPVFSAGLSTYDDMLDPSGTDARRLAACRALLTSVERHAAVERWRVEDRYIQERLPDPYTLEWRTSREGCVLETISGILT